MEGRFSKAIKESLLIVCTLVMTRTLSGAEGLHIVSTTDDSAVVKIPSELKIGPGVCLEVRKGDELLGFLQVNAIADARADCKLLAGKADPSCEAIPIVPPGVRIALLTDEPEGRIALELKTLYPDLVTTDPAEFGKCEAMVCVTTDRGKAKDLGFSIVETFAKPKKTAIVSLEAYAAARGAQVAIVKHKAPLQIKIERVTDLTRGMSIGQEVNWYGTEGEGEDQKEKDKFHATIARLPRRETVAVIATSTANGNPIFVEEKIGQGRIIAMDLTSPNERAGYDAGSKNKWVFPGNILVHTVWQSKYRTEKLPYDQFVNLEKAIAERHKDRASMTEEGRGSDDDPVYSLLLGDAAAPRFLITGALHGGEWKNSYALLDVIQTLLDNPDRDYKVDWLLKNFSVKFIPMLNVAGYKKYGQVNKNKCDLNRNYPFHWESYKGDGGWRAKYPAEVLRGKAPFSEAESQIVKKIVETEKPIGLVDMHMHEIKHGPMICCPHKEACADLNELKAVKILVDQRLRNRYLFGCDKEGKYIQLQLRGGNYGGDRPFLVNWAGTLGIRSTVFETVGGWEDSLPHGDVVIEDCLNFLYVVGVNFLARK